VGIRGLLARTSFRPVKSEYRALYSRFTGPKNRGSVRHALTLASSATDAAPPGTCVAAAVLRFLRCCYVLPHLAEGMKVGKAWSGLVRDGAPPATPRVLGVLFWQKVTSHPPLFLERQRRMGDGGEAR
jgi:hypothetical protein